MSFCLPASLPACRYADTWEALDRRITDVVKLEQAARDPGALLSALSSVVTGALSQASRLVAQAPSVVGKL